MVNTRASVTAAALLFLTAGCGGKSESPGADATARPTATVTVTAKPKEPTQTGVLTGSVSYATVTALELDPHVPVDNYPAQKRWASVLVKLCATADKAQGKPLAVSWVPWTVNDASDSITDLTGGVTYPVPTFPTEPRRLVTGQCIKGWITFNVAPGVRIASVTYTPAGEAPMTWKF